MKISGMSNRVGPDIRPSSISDRIPDIETIRPEFRQYNLLYFTTKIGSREESEFDNTDDGLS